MTDQEKKENNLREIRGKLTSREATDEMIGKVSREFGEFYADCMITSTLQPLLLQYNSIDKLYDYWITHVFKTT